MSHGYQIMDQQAAYSLTLQVVDWVDVFTRKRYRDIVIDSLRYCQKNKGLEIFAYVIMSNHVHLIVRAEHGNLSDVIRDMKRHTSKKIVESIENEDEYESRKDWILNRFKYAASKHKRNDTYQFWTHENHAVILYSPEFVKERLDYIHDNPVRAGIVEKAWEYIYSSAKNYVDEKGLLDVIVLSRAKLGIIDNQYR